MRLARANVALILLLTCAAPARAAGVPPMLLATQYGELCTMCEGYLRCGPGGGTAFTLYHVRPKDFWQQVATIGDWFMAVFRSPRDERRPLDVYRHAADPGGRVLRAVLTGQEARLSLSRARLEVPGGWIDRRGGAWHRDDAPDGGRCEALPIPAGRKLAGEFGAGRP